MCPKTNQNFNPRNVSHLKTEHKNDKFKCPQSDYINIQANHALQTNCINMFNQSPYTYTLPILNCVEILQKCPKQKKG